MASSPQTALPWVQTLAGLFSGYLNAKQQERANPRAGFSRLPILAGGLSGLATGLAGAAQRAELLRQEQRGANDALGAYAAMSGRPVSEIQQLFGGLTPVEYRGDVGTAIRQGTGNQAVGRQLNIANPQGLYSADTGMLSSLFGEAQKQLADTATANALPMAQAAGLNDAGGNQTGNQIMFPVVPSLASMFGPQHRAVTAALEGGPGKRMPNLKFAPWPTMGGSPSPGIPATGAPEDGATRVYSASPTGLSAGVSVARPGVPVSEETYADLGYPKTLAQIAMGAKDPGKLISQYGASASAANDRNSQLTSTLNTAQTIRGANERAILDYDTPTIAGIIANGTPQQKADLKDYAEAGYRRQQSLMGTDKPATRTEIAGSVKQIQNQPTREGRLAAAKLAIQTNTLSPQSALDAANSSVFGASQPITMQDLRGAGAAPQQTAPPAAQHAPSGTAPNVAPGNGPSVAPRAPSLSDFLPYTPNMSGVNFIPRASTGSVRKRARENNGQGRVNRRNYGY